jgi:hypothetical protein
VDTALSQSPASARWPLYAGLAALALALALSTALSLGDRQETDIAKSGPDATPVAVAPVATETAPAEPKVTEEDYSPWIKPSKELVAAFEAATGHRRPFNVETDGEIFGTSPMRIIQLPFSKVLITGEGVEPGCLYCQGAIGICYFREEAGKVVVTGRWPSFILGWHWGQMPENWRLTTRFTAFPAIVAWGEFNNHGIVVRSSTLTELRPEGPVGSGPIGTGFDDRGFQVDMSGCAVTGRVVNVRRDIGFDVQITGGVSKVERYRKRGKRFVSVSPIDWQDPCSRKDSPRT